MRFNLMFNFNVLLYPEYDKSRKGKGREERGTGEEMYLT